MKRALGWLAASYGAHVIGLIAFWWTWTASFGVAGRTIDPDWDIPLAYLELLASGLTAGVLTLKSTRGHGGWLIVPQGLSMLLASVWVWSVFLIAGHL